MAFSFVDINGKRYSHDRDPSECPICHVAVQPESHVWLLTNSDEGPERILEIVFHCPRRECSHFFIARYKRSESAPGSIPGVLEPPPLMGMPRLGEFILYETTPSSPMIPDIPREIRDISPLFPEIYGQAIAAESYGLNQLAGMGYRKSLEFLIKDYCISTHPQDAAKIKTTQLSPCIKQFVDSPEVKICAERATWLGNDETHYERRWADKDISNLKQLIQLTVNWIHNTILTQKYLTEMPN